MVDMENMKANIVVEEVGDSDVIDLKEVSKSFSFPAFPLTNLEFMSNFKIRRPILILGNTYVFSVVIQLVMKLRSG